MVLATHVGPILDFRAGLNIKTMPDATLAWLPDWDSGCAVRCTAAIHVSSDHHGMGSVASHLRGSSVHSFVYSNIYIGVVGEKLPTHTTPLRLLRRRLGLLRRRNFLCFRLPSSAAAPVFSAAVGLGVFRRLESSPRSPIPSRFSPMAEIPPPEQVW